MFGEKRGASLAQAVGVPFPPALPTAPLFLGAPNKATPPHRAHRTNPRTHGPQAAVRGKPRSRGKPRAGRETLRVKANPGGASGWAGVLDAVDWLCSGPLRKGSS
ncbi:hypothetical protein Acsp05_59410 [Actinokineospora sp. NBRC 105648]|nr:hypothetical protein Acsp05_59410 [Actinokineospora sp. NBRC 105648]